MIGCSRILITNSQLDTLSFFSEQTVSNKYLNLLALFLISSIRLSPNITFSPSII